MVCNQCGKPLADHTNYCEHCKQFVRPITYNAYLAQEDAKELKLLPDDSVEKVKSSSNFFEQFLSQLKNPQSRMISIAFAVMSGISAILLILLAIVMLKPVSVENPNITPVSPVVSETDVSASDVSGSDLFSEKMKMVGSKEYGFIIIPDSWINAKYDESSSSIQYVSEDGKNSATLFKSFQSENTLNKCVSDVQQKMKALSLTNLTADKIIVNNLSMTRISGSIKTENNQICNVAAYLTMDDNDNLFMLILASYGDLSELNTSLNSFSLDK